MFQLHILTFILKNELLGRRIHNAEYVLSDAFIKLNGYSRQLSSVFMKMQQDQPVKLYEWLDCGSLQDDTAVSPKKAKNNKKTEYRSNLFLDS